MKITKQQLKKLIKEEMESVLQEQKPGENVQHALNRDPNAMSLIKDLHEIIDRTAQKNGFKSRGLSSVPFMAGPDEHGYISVRVEVPLKQVKQVQQAAPAGQQKQAQPAQPAGAQQKPVKQVPPAGRQQ